MVSHKLENSRKLELVMVSQKLKRLSTQKLQPFPPHPRNTYKGLQQAIDERKPIIKTD